MSTRELANWCSQLKFEDLPKEVVEQAKKAVLDFLGVATYVGTSKPWGKIIGEFAASEGACQPQSTILGFGTKTLASKAALANGTMALGFEYEDVHLRSATHPYPMLLPAALALTEKEKRSGRDLLTAVVVGYEVTGRAGWAIGPAHAGRATTSKGLYLPATNAIFGAAAAAAKALQLDGRWFNHAIGHAAMATSGLFQAHEEGAMARRLNGGRAAESGVTAALLAQRGFTGPEQGLEGKYGYYNVFFEGDFDIKKLTDGLGKSWEIGYTWFKAYPMNATLHAPVECVLKIRREHNVRPEDVAEIVSYWHEMTPILAKKEIPTIVSAQFSLPFALGVTMVRGRATGDEFTEETIRDPKVFEMMQKVSVAHSPELIEKGKSASFPGKVTIKLKDGRQYTEEVLFPKGDWNNPMSTEEFKVKFDNNTSKVFSPQQQEEVFQLVMGLEKVRDVNKLTGLLAPSRKGN